MNKDLKTMFVIVGLVAIAYFGFFSNVSGLSVSDTVNWGSSAGESQYRYGFFGSLAPEVTSSFCKARVVFNSAFFLPVLEVKSGASDYMIVFANLNKVQRGVLNSCKWSWGIAAA